MTPLWAWLREHPTLGDLALAGAVWLAFGVVPSISPFSELYYADSSVQLRVGIALLMALPLIARRASPLVALAASCVAGLIHLDLYDRPLPIDVAFLAIVYSVAVHGRSGPARRSSLVVGWLACVVCALRWLTGYGVTQIPVLVVFLALAVTATWTGGALIRTRRAFTEQALERARQGELDRERALRLAASQERAQIARELHDIVAHSLAVMIVQADGGRYAAAADPAKAAGSLETIAATGREALSQMRHLLGVLRDGEPAATGEPGVPRAPVTPQPVLADLPALLAGVRGAGVRVDARLPDPLPDVPAQLAAVAYRIVQESLTNVLKHAGPRAGVTVTVALAGGQLRVEVRDDGNGAASALAPGGIGVVGEGGPADNDDAGRGLIGMRERAALVDGRVSAGPTAGGGWTVRAALPVPELAVTG